MSIAFTTLNIVAKAICRADLPYGLALTMGSLFGAKSVHFYQAISVYFILAVTFAYKPVEPQKKKTQNKTQVSAA